MNCGEVTTERERLREPPPHVTEQAVSSDQLEYLQWTGQCLRWHFLTCCLCGQRLPPENAWRATPRVLICWPRPHGAEHGVYSDQGSMTQSTGQRSVSHACCCLQRPHGAPPWRARVVAASAHRETEYRALDEPVLQFRDPERAVAPDL